MAPVVPGHREGDPETTNSPYVPGFGAEFQPDPLKQKRLGEEGSRLSRKIAASFVTEGGTLHLIN